MITKRKYYFFIITILVFAIFAICSLNGNAVQATAYADGTAEVAMELESGHILHNKNVDERLPMASTTKIMTALIVCENSDLDEVITVPVEAVGIEGSSIYLKKDEKISIKDLLYGLMLRSGNDAATALAIHCGGSVESFVDKMNERAVEIGANDTHFMNPSGLPDEGHYTTARDLCNIARAAMLNEIFNRVVSTKNYTGDFRSFTNKNKFLRNVEGANGVKTGYTTKAGRCLVSSVKRDDMDVVCVVLNCYDMYERSEEIVETCFRNYSVKTISEDKIFTMGGREYKLKNAFRSVFENACNLSYSVKPDEDDINLAELNIFDGKDLLFCLDLVNIKAVK